MRTIYHKMYCHSCKSLIHYEITDACKGVRQSLQRPVGAITGSVKQRHVIDQDTCIKCGKCMDSCKFGAIVKD